MTTPPLAPGPSVHGLAHWPLVDVVVLLVVVMAVVGALRRRAGVLGALGAGIGALVVSWLVVVAAATWATPSVADLAAHSRLLHVVPAPHHALDQAGRLVEQWMHGRPG